MYTHTHTHTHTQHTHIYIYKRYRRIFKAVGKHDVECISVLVQLRRGRECAHTHTHTQREREREREREIESQTHMTSKKKEKGRTDGVLWCVVRPHMCSLTIECVLLL
jgi:hypothetical protein